MDLHGLLDPNFKKFIKEGGFVGHVNLAGAVAGWLLCWGQSSGSGPKQTEKRLLK